jgi:hypothetical protein
VRDVDPRVSILNFRLFRGICGLKTV